MDNQKETSYRVCTLYTVQCPFVVTRIMQEKWVKSEAVLTQIELWPLLSNQPNELTHETV